MKIPFLIMALAMTVNMAHAASKGDECTVIIASDLHFDMPPETDQYVNVLAMNRLGAQQKHIDGVLLLGDLCDKVHPDILRLFRQRYEKGPGERTIHYDVYPTLGNHDVAPAKGRPYDDRSGNEININYMDSILHRKLQQKQILNLDTSSLSYSFNLGHVHFVNSQLSAGETSYCRSNMEWLENDLRTYASHGEPVVFMQHYGFDDDGLTWWDEANRDRLITLLGQYNLAGFFVGHAHAATLRYYRKTPIFQVNNGWKDGDGQSSFLLLNIKGNQVTLKNYRIEDNEGHVALEQPVLRMTAPVNR
uniref:Calcineurin-like phosphoesterase domain-containing protein n=2 Tax=unclassified Prevotella TaxID=2638335 RepID=A0AB33IY41_9BACT